MIAEGLVGMGAVVGPVETVLEEKSYQAFFPHQTSHWLGLDTHDPGPYRGQDGPVNLEPGMVFTVEPGLYFSPGTCPAVPELEGTGIRIEDDVLITEDGAKVLTAGLPTGIEELAGTGGGRMTTRIPGAPPRGPSSGRAPSEAKDTGIVRRLAEPGPMAAVELRPPRLGLDAARRHGFLDRHVPCGPALRPAGHLRPSHR